MDDGFMLATDPGGKLVSPTGRERGTYLPSRTIQQSITPRGLLLRTVTLGAKVPRQ